MGWEDPAWSLRPLPSGTDLPVGKKGEWDQGKPWRKQKTSEGLAWMELCTPGWEKEALDGEQSRGSSGPAQQLLHPAPLAPEPLSLPQSVPSPASSLAEERQQPRDPSLWESRGLHVTLPKGNQKRHVRTERNPTAGTGSCKQTPRADGSDSRRVGQERGSQPQPEPGPSPQANQTAGGGDGAGWIWSEDAGKSSGKESEAAHSLPHHGQAR